MVQIDRAQSGKSVPPPMTHNHDSARSMPSNTKITPSHLFLGAKPTLLAPLLLYNLSTTKTLYVGRGRYLLMASGHLSQL